MYIMFHRGTRISIDTDLASHGGVWDDDSVIYQRLLDRAAFNPTGRVVILPEDCSTWDRNPIIRDSATAIDRVREFSENYLWDLHCPMFFDNDSDIVFVYELGETVVLDHDQRFFWGKSSSCNSSKAG